MNVDDKWEISYSSRAKRDMNEISSYITEATLEPDIADRQIARITEAADSLYFMPNRHRLHFDERLRAKGVHVMIVGKYYIWYVLDKEQKIVTIARVIHSARDINKVLGEATDDEPEK
jgi:toxin ParE1/3/4